MMVERETTSTNLTAKVSSAVALTGDEQSALGEKLDARFGQPLELRFDVDPSLLGGVKVRVGDQVIDGSVKGKLEALAQSLGSRQ
jgi:F-type H+-transporting ATPase subunit delta